MLDKLFLEITQILIRIITGRLLTEKQIGSLTGSVVGKQFRDWFPKSQDEIEAQKRLDSAKHHIAEANRLIGSLKDDLDSQANQLQKLSHEIDDKRNLAERYRAIATINEQASAAFRSELEETL